jgi:hypothetical protein
MPSGYRPLVFFLGSLCVTLLVIVLVLYRDNQAYRAANRGLIIQNDSILSANMLLQQGPAREVNPKTATRHAMR